MKFILFRNDRDTPCRLQIRNSTNKLSQSAHSLIRFLFFEDFFAQVLPDAQVDLHRCKSFSRRFYDPQRCTTAEVCVEIFMTRMLGRRWSSRVVSKRVSESRALLQNYSYVSFCVGRNRPLRNRWYRSFVVGRHQFENQPRLLQGFYRD